MSAYLRILTAALDRLPFRRRGGKPGAAALARQDAYRFRESRRRLAIAVSCFLVAYAVIGARLTTLALTPEADPVYRLTAQDSASATRPEIRDRNGEILATDIKMGSLFAEPRRIIDADEASELITAVLPDLDAREVREKLSSRRGFVWLKREITPRQQAELHRLGLPGIGFLRENKRVYPTGRLAAYVLGHVNVDNRGIAGLEQYVDNTGLADLHLAGFARNQQLEPIDLSIDMRAQYALRDELEKAVEKYKAKGAMGIVLDVRTGEVVAMHSLPDYDPNRPIEALEPDRLNRIATGVFEMGSIFKSMTIAMALDSGQVKMTDYFDATHPLRFGRHTINDFRGKKRPLSVPEVFKYSSNIGTGRMALKLGREHHQEFLRKMGFLDRLRTELPESAMPLVPRRWVDINTVTISYGHGLSVTPMQMAAAGAALVNGGHLITPTFFERSQEEAMARARRVISEDTSAQMRYLFRLNAESGTATNAEVAGYRVGGKTGTAEKVENGRYSNKLMTSFLGAFPMDDPRYLTLVSIDEPQGLPETHGFRTSGWNAAPVTAKIVNRIAPMLGVPPEFDAVSPSMVSMSQ